MGDANHKYPVGSKWKLNEKGRAYNRDIIKNIWIEDSVFTLHHRDYENNPIFLNNQDKNFVGYVSWSEKPEIYLTRTDSNTLQGFIFGLEEEIRKGP